MSHSEGETAALVQLYTMCITELRQTEINALSSNRREKAARYLFERDQKLCLAAGVLLDRGLQAYGLRENAVHVVPDQNGKPRLADHPAIHFSLSHSGCMAAAAFSDHEVGCDIEPLRSVDWELVDLFFHPYEQKALRASQNPDRDFTRLWVCKESFLKALGTGLNDSLAQVCVRLTGQTSELVQTLSPRRWNLTEFRIHDYYAAVCEDQKRGGSL